MNQKDRALRFATLHVKGDPLLLYNAWDAGSAKAIAKTGASAIATSSWAVALPVSIDVEGGYSDIADVCADNVARLLDQGVAGINFEDRVVAGTGLHTIGDQCARIAAIRRMADARGIPLFINARTDAYFGAGIDPKRAAVEVLERAAASGLYAQK